MIILRRLRILTTSLLFICIQVVSADEFHYNNMLIGDRASGLAGSYVAVADDTAGLYYNPAGIVYAAGNSLTASMNAYNVTVTRYKDVLNGDDWERKSSALLPNFFGITQKIGRGMAGFSYSVTDSIQEDQSQTFLNVPSEGSEFSVNFNNQDTTTLFGPSFAMPISKKMSMGISLFGHIRSQELVINQLFEFEDETILNDGGNTVRNLYHSENKYVSLYEYGVKPVLGVMYAPTEDISLGLTVSDTFLLSSDYEVQNTVISNFECEDSAQNSSGQCAYSSLIRLTANTSKTRHMPWNLNFGAAYFVNNRLMLTSSMWVHEPVNGSTSPLINAAIALEYYISGKLAIRMGSYTNFANTPNIEEDKDIDAEEHIDIVGSTLSLSHFTRSSTLTFGVSGAYGKGKAQILDDSETQNIEYYGISMFLSGSNSF